jgi:hypothetical protein
MPTWVSDALYEHWLAEYWQPGTGWVAMDPSLGRWDPDRRTRVVLATSNEEDEDRAFDPLHERFIMPGAAYLSSLELSQTLYAADLTDTDAINTANVVGRFILDAQNESRLTAAARREFEAMHSKLVVGKSTAARYEAILATASSGSADRLRKELQENPQR